MLDFSQMVPAEKILNNSKNLSFFQLFQEAQSFLLSQPWCISLKHGYLDFAIEGVLGIFLFEIQGKNPAIDKYQWIIVGDLPPAYIYYDTNPTGKLALEGYIYEMKKWVEAVKNSQSIEELIPVTVPPKLEFANMLQSRLEFINKEILPYYDEYKIDFLNKVRNG